MNALELLKAVFALAIVLGLILALAYGLKRYAPQLLGRLQSPLGRKRMEVVETLVLDPVRRLVLVRLDDEERLILLGEGRELAEPPVERKAKAIVAQSIVAQSIAEAAAPRSAPAQPAPKPKLVVPQPPAEASRPEPSRPETPRGELPKPRMYRAPERAVTNPAVDEVNDDLF